MIGPAYLLTDPLEGGYSYQWRADPIVCFSDGALY